MPKLDSLSKRITWRIKILEEIMELISLSRYKENIIFKGNMIVNLLLNVSNNSDNLEMTFKNISLNKFNINRVFKDIFYKVNYEVINIDLVKEKTRRAYRVEIKSHHNNWDEVISIVVDEGTDDFPNAFLINYHGLTKNDFLIFTYSINDIIAEKFWQIVYFNKRNIDLLLEIMDIMTMNIINENELVVSLKSSASFYKIKFNYKYLRKRLKEIREDKVLRSKMSYNKTSIVYDDLMLILEWIIKMLKNEEEI